MPYFLSLLISVCFATPSLASQPQQADLERAFLLRHIARFRQQISTVGRTEYRDGIAFRLRLRISASPRRALEALERSVHDELWQIAESGQEEPAESIMRRFAVSGIRFAVLESLEDQENRSVVDASWILDLAAVAAYQHYQASDPLPRSLLAALDAPEVRVRNTAMARLRRGIRRELAEAMTNDFAWSRIRGEHQGTTVEGMRALIQRWLSSGSDALSPVGRAHVNELVELTESEAATAQSRVRSLLQEAGVISAGLHLLP